jgi:uncharacterized protein YndB with AHSA1/START domain
MVKWLTRVIVVLLVAGVALFLVGTMLPQDHTASRTTHVSQPPERVWATITDVAAFPSWRKEVDSVAQLPPHDGKMVWREISKHQNKLTYEAETSVPPEHLVTRIIDKDLPFGGSWDYAISPDGSGSKITITENGEIYNPAFRVVSRAMGQTASIDAYLGALAARLGDTYVPIR